METSGPDQACNGIAFLYLALLAIRHTFYTKMYIEVPSQVTVTTALHGFLASRYRKQNVKTKLTTYTPFCFGGGSKVTTTPIFNLDTRWRRMFSFTLCPYCPWRKGPGAHWIGGCPGLITVLKANSFVPVGKWNHWRSTLHSPLRYADAITTSFLADSALCVRDVMAR